MRSTGPLKALDAVVSMAIAVRLMPPIGRIALVIAAALDGFVSALTETRTGIRSRGSAISHP